MAVAVEAPTEAPVQPQTQSQVIEQAPEQSIEEIVRAAARKYGISEDYFVSIAMCESTLGQNLVNPHYTAADGSNPKGVFQFIRSTYLSFAEQAGFPVQDDRMNHYNNINLAAWAFKNGHAGHWECQ